MGGVHMQDTTLELGERDRKPKWNCYCRYASTTPILSQSIMPVWDERSVYTPAHIFTGGHIPRQVTCKCILDKCYGLCQQHHGKKAVLCLSCFSPLLLPFLCITEMPSEPGEATDGGENYCSWLVNFKLGQFLMLPFLTTVWLLFSWLRKYTNTMVA